eukprot:1146994-Pelagomonas_calceolata.AAC.1
MQLRRALNLATRSKRGSVFSVCPRQGEWLCWPCYEHERQLRASGVPQAQIRPPRWEMAARGLSHRDLQVGATSVVIIQRWSGSDHDPEGRGERTARGLSHMGLQGDFERQHIVRNRKVLMQAAARKVLLMAINTSVRCFISRPWQDPSICLLSLVRLCLSWEKLKNPDDVSLEGSTPLILALPLPY